MLCLEEPRLRCINTACCFALFLINVSVCLLSSARHSCVWFNAFRPTQLTAASATTTTNLSLYKTFDKLSTAYNPSRHTLLRKHLRILSTIKTSVVQQQPNVLPFPQLVYVSSNLNRFKCPYHDKIMPAVTRNNLKLALKEQNTWVTKSSKVENASKRLHTISFSEYAYKNNDSKSKSNNTQTIASAAPLSSKASADIEDISYTHSDSTVHLPANFHHVWKGIKDMRSNRTAPVDTMGAESLGNPSAPKEIWRFHKLVAAMLSSQTKDEAVAACMKRLLAHGLTIQNILETPEEKLKDLLYGVGFHNNKCKYLKQVCEILKNEYESDIPSDYKSLIALPGVGPKMTQIVLALAWGKVEGIAVDVHVHRISNRLGWVKTKKPEETEAALEAFLPKPLWREINLLLVGFGQERCKPINPQCSECLVQKWCPYGRKEVRKLPK